MLKRVKYRELVLFAYLLGLISFLFLKCQEISAQEVAAFATILVLFYPSRIVGSKGHYKRLAIVLLVYMVFEAIRSLVRYGQGINVIIYLSIEFISIILYLYFTGFPQEKVDQMFEIVVKFTQFELICLWVVVLLYNFVGINLLDEVNIKLRNGRARVYNGAFFLIFGMILVCSKIINNKNQNIKTKKRDYFFIMAGMVYLFYGCQSRMLLVVTLGTLMIMYIISYRKITKKTMSILIAAVVLCFLYTLPFIQNYLSVTFGKIFEGTDSSVIPRIRAVKHYIEIVKNDKMFGMGFMSYSRPSNNLYDIPYILRGKWGEYFTNDVGIVGYYMTFGIVGLLIYIYMFIKMIKQGLKERYQNPHKFGIIIFLLLASISATLFDQERQSYIPLVFLIMEFNVPKSVRIHNKSL